MRLALLLHLLAVVFWIGGMAFAQTALGPALAETLEPPQRLKLLDAILRRFLGGVTLAVLVILASGAYMMLAPGAAGSRPAVHAMLGIGLLMVVIFAFIRMRSYPALRAAVSKAQWPVAGAAATTIRRLVATNLVLGIVVIAVALLAP